MSLKAIAAAALGLASCAGFAADLGALTVLSHLGEPFLAKLEISNIDLNAEQLKIRVAPPASYVREGLTQPPEVSEFSLFIESQSPCVVRIEGASPMPTRDLPLIIDKMEQGRLVSKVYNVTLQDKPPEAPAAEEKPAEQPGAEEKAAEQPKAEDKPAGEPAAEAKPEEKPAEQPKSEEKPAEQPKAEEKPAQRPEAEEKAADQP
ncbi:MAG: hypothetical protein HUK26_01870, partial [Duodenibacillus sp.]|nr:hypothetical protein [Duodenibacillus sp.]